jgi:hypothetical protein
LILDGLEGFAVYIDQRSTRAGLYGEADAIYQEGAVKNAALHDMLAAAPEC